MIQPWITNNAMPKKHFIRLFCAGKLLFIQGSVFSHEKKPLFISGQILI